MEKQVKQFEVFVFDDFRGHFIRWGTVYAFDKQDADKSIARTILDQFGHLNYYIGEEV